ncbi:MAG: hypothetical protein ACR2OX_01710 [Methyloligellaceae bacterium]
MNTQKRIAEEIAALHVALADWLSGRCPRDGGFFQREFRDRFHTNFFNIQPAGMLLTRADLLNALDNGYGRSPEFRICVREVKVHQALNDGHLILATYEAYQTGAVNSDRSDNARFSSALVEQLGEGHFLWHAIHETWLPEEKHDAENFRF